VLEVVDLRVRYGGVEAVAGASLRIDAPGIVGLIGPNGAGKSSLLAAVGGQTSAAGGTVMLDGTNITRLPAHKRARLGVTRTFQTASVFDRLTAFENLLVAGMGAPGAALRHAMFNGSKTREAAAATRARAFKVIDDLELQSVIDSYGSELSGGQRRLVEIGRCLMCSPKLLLLDEPMVGVAPHLVQRIGAAAHAIRDSGVAIIIVEHEMKVVEDFCDRVVVMAAGQVIHDGKYEEVIKSDAVIEAYLV
jgi:ABC-type branched-subunit amino acid transport system ATPase component